MSAKAKAKPHYVNNRDFSEAVMDYAVRSQKAKAKDKRNNFSFIIMVILRV